MTKFICGIAYNSMGSYRTKEGKNKTKAYSSWRSILQRCYDKKSLERYSSYVGCAIASDWFDFQDFAAWFYSNPYSELDYQLDKDLLIPNNKIYSPETCCFVPRELNNLLLDNSSVRGDLPQGVCFHKKNNVYIANIRIKCKQTYLGSFDSPDEAYQAYKTAKEAHVKSVALEWKDRIGDDVFNALMSWQLAK